MSKPTTTDAATSQSTPVATLQYPLIPVELDSDSDHEHETLDTHHDLPAVFPRPPALSRPAAQGPSRATALAGLRARSGSESATVQRRGSLTRPRPLQPIKPPSTSHTPTPPEGQQDGSSFPPLSHTESRHSTRTFLEPAGLITGYPDLARADTRVSRTGIVYTFDKHERDGDDEKDVAVGTSPNGVEFTFPDGGLRAWICVFGGAAALFCGFGLAPCAGVFQTYYQETFLQDYSSSAIAWIGSAQAAMAFGLAAFTGSLFDLYGHKPLVIAGSILLPLGFCMLSLCTKYYQIFLCHTTLISLGMNMMFLSPVGVVSQWFQVNRGRAFAIMSSGAALGATVWPIIFGNLPQRIGFPWTMRLIGFMTGFLGVLAFFCLKTRLPPKPPGPFFYLSAFKMPAYSFVTLGSVCYVISFFVWQIFTETCGRLLQLEVAPWLLIILNASSCLGRIAASFIADTVGIYNITIVSCTIMSVLYWIWMACRTQPSLIAINVLFGIFSGTFNSLQAPLIVKLIPDVRLAGTSVGQVLFIQSIGQLIGPPIAGALLGHGSREEQLSQFKYCIILGAALQTINVGALTMARRRLSKQLTARV